MLHTPVNAYPHNVTVDVSKPVAFNFIHTGSAMNHCRYTLFDTGNTTPLATHWVSHTEDLYNGDVVCTVYKDTTNLTNGTSYKWTVTQFQDAYDIFAMRAQVQWDSFIRYAYVNENAVFMRSVPEGVTFSSIDQFIPVAYQTTGIEQPVYNGNTLVGGQYLEINGERRLILGYWEDYVLYLLYGFNHNADYPYTSAIIVDSPFTTYPSYDPEYPSRRIPYRVFKNYLDSPYYYFKARKTPTTSLTVNYEDGILNCDSTYSQDNGSLVESYSWKVSSYSDDYSDVAVATGTVQSFSDIATLIASNEVVDNQHIPITTGLTTIPVGNNITTFGEQYGKIVAYDSTTGIATLESPLYNFPDYGDTVSVYCGVLTEAVTSEEYFNERLSNDFWIYPMTGTKRVEMTLRTGDGIHYVTATDYTFADESETEVLESVVATENRDNGQCCVKVEWSLNESCSYEDYVFNVYRSVDGGVYQPLDRNVVKATDDVNGTYTDHLVGAEHTYQYCVVPISSSDLTTAGKAVESESLSVHYIGCLLTSVKKDKTLFGKDIYIHGDTWTLNIDLGDTDITINTDRTYLQGGGRYPKMTQTPSRYVTGSLSCTLGEIDCTTKTYTGSIVKLEEWRKFLLGNTVFLLRSTKGDCRLVTIDANPTESYSAGKLNSYVPVTVKFSYTEIGSTDNIIVR